jgi:hypothetical protein
MEIDLGLAAACGNIAMSRSATFSFPFSALEFLWCQTSSGLTVEKKNLSEAKKSFFKWTKSDFRS